MPFCLPDKQMPKGLRKAAKALLSMWETNATSTRVFEIVTCQSTSDLDCRKMQALAYLIAITACQGLCVLISC